MKRRTSGWMIAAAFLGGAAMTAIMGAGQAHAERDATPLSVARQWGRVLVQIEQDYVDPVDRDKLAEGAILGMVAHLDPHSSYMTREEYTLFRSETEGSFGGVGIEVDVRNETVIVLAPIEGGPAEKAGIRSGDQIVGVDTESTQDRGIDKVIKKMRGAPGTKVRLTVKRAGVAAPIVFDLTRDIVRVSSVKGARMVQGIGYLRIKQFQERTHAEFIAALGTIRKEGNLSGLILDLRSNPGGLVDEATDIADEFLSSGLIYSMRTRSRIIDEAKAQEGGALADLPVVVLVNEWSASASELLAGALQDQKRATIVGLNTFGKGSVQTVFDLPGGAGLKLTTARYYTPLGHAIQADGVHPDIVAIPTLTDPSGPSVLRERDLEGHLRGEGVPPVAQAKGVPVAVAPGEIAVPREPPPDPRNGTDPLLKLGFETLLGKLASSGGRNAASH